MNYFTQCRTETCSTVSVCCRVGDLETLQTLIAVGQPLDVKDNRGWKPIHEAAAGNHYECLVELLKHETVDVDDPTYEGATPLLLACSGGHKDAVEILLQHGSTVNFDTAKEETPLLAAVKSNSVECVDLLLRKDATVNGADWNGTTPLHEAAKLNDLKIAQLLLRWKANLFARDDNGITPFFEAARHGDLDALKLFLEIENKYIEEKAGSCQSSCERLINMVACDGASPIILATQGNHVDCVEFLLENGADVLCATSDAHITAVHMAAYKGYIRILEILLEKVTVEDLEFPPPTKEKTKRSILHIATEVGRCAVIEILVRKGLNLELEMKAHVEFTHLQTEAYLSPEIYTPLGIACRGGNHRAVETLLKAWANPNPSSPEVVPPIVAAVLSENEETVRILCERGAFVNTSPIFHGRTVPLQPVVAAALWPYSVVCSLRIFEVILKFGANVEFLGDGQNLQNLKKVLSRKLVTEEWPDCVSSISNVLNKYMDRGSWNKFVKQFQCLPVEFVRKIEMYGNSKPLTLEELCRLEIRKILIRNNRYCLLKSVTELPLPCMLHDYLLYK